MRKIMRFDAKILLTHLQSVCAGVASNLCQHERALLEAIMYFGTRDRFALLEYDLRLRHNYAAGMTLAPIINLIKC